MAIAGLEGRFSWDGGVAVLNLKYDDTGDDVFPQFKVRRIDGLHSLGDSEDVRDLPPGREGEIARKSRRRGKTVTFTGLVRARSLDDLRDYETALLAAFDEQLDEKRMDVTRHPLLDPTGDYARYFYARSLACDVGEEQGPPHSIAIGWERVGIISVRMGDRRYYDAEEKTAMLSVADADDVETVVAHNGGSVATDPIITVEGNYVATAFWPNVRLATTGPLPAHVRAGNTITAAEFATYGLSVDGRVVNAPTVGGGDLVLVKDEVDQSKNGLYQASVIVEPDVDHQTGVYPGADPRTKWVLDRIAAADATGDFAQHKQVAVTDGATNAGRIFEQTTAAAINVNVTGIAFSIPVTTHGLVVANDTIGKSLIFPGLAIVDGDELVIDFHARSITKNGVEIPQVLSMASSWWDAGVAGLKPGDNTIRVQSFDAASADFEIDVTVAWHDAFV